MRKVIGFEKFVSKKGLPCAVISCVRDFTQEEVARGSFGTKSEMVMVYGADSETINDKFIGKELCGFFGYSGGRLVVQSPACK